MWFLYIFLGMVIIISLFIIIGLIKGNNGKVIPDDRIYQKNSRTNKQTNKKPPKFNNDMSLSQIVAKIENLQDLKSVEKKAENYSIKFFETNKNEYDVLSKKYENALKIGEKMIFKVQFIPDYEIDTPLKILKQSYKIADRKDLLFNDIENVEKYGKWIEYTGTDLLYDSINEISEPKPEYLKSAIKFREIIEDDELIEEKKNKLIKLIKSDNEFKENFFPDDIDDLNDFLKKYIKLPK